MSHRYNVVVRPIDSDGGSLSEPLSFDVTNHDDLFVIVQKIKDADVVPESEAAELAIGLKLFSEVLIRHRRTPLFEQLWPHFGAFMKRLKGGRSTLQEQADQA